MMKKLITMLLATSLLLTLAACGKGEVPGAYTDDPAYFSDETENTVEEPDESTAEETVSEDVSFTECDPVADFYEAQKQWFLFDSGMQCDYEDKKQGEIAGYEADFFRVTDDGIGTLDDLKNYLSQYVEESYVEELVNTCDMYTEFDGALYACPAGRGDDLTIGWVEFETESDKLIVKIHRLEYYDLPGEWFENGVVDSYEFPYTVEDGHAKFESMFYLCGWEPVTEPDPEHNEDALEAALIGLIAGNWVAYVEETDYELQINEDGSYTYCVESEPAYSGRIFSSRSDDGSYMMEGEEISSTLFYLREGENGLPVLEFENGNLIYEKEGEG